MTAPRSRIGKTVRKLAWFFAALPLVGCDDSIVRPGGSATITVGHVATLERELIRYNIEELWNADSLEFDPAPVALEDGSTFSWEPKFMESHNTSWESGKYSRNRLGYPFYKERRIWVKIGLPKDPRLVGRKLEGELRMELSFARIPPFRQSGIMTDTKSIEKKIEIEVADAEAIALYETSWLERGIERVLDGLGVMVAIVVLIWLVSSLLPKYHD